MKPEFYYPTKPFFVTQRWGLSNPAMYSQFGFTKHNGLDTHLPKDKTGYAPFNGFVVRNGNQPTGGGIFVGFMSEDEFQFDDGKYRVLVDLLHCEKIILNEGDRAELGEKLAILDNSGFTTGPHLHTQWRRTKNWNGKYGKELRWEEVDRNAANNSIDPAPYFTGKYAQDYLEPIEPEPIPEPLTEPEKIEIIKKEITLIEKIIALFKKLISG